MVASVRSFAVLYVSTLFLASCAKGATTSTPNLPEPMPSAPSSQSIGPGGGSVASSDGRIEIVVPAGALASDAVVAVEPMTSTAPGAIGSGYRLQPEGVTFAKPVALKFKLSANDVQGTAGPYLWVAWKKPSGVWETTPSTFDPATRVLSAETTHFSEWSAVAGLQLVPATASVRVSETQQIGIRYCKLTKESDDVLCPIGTPCKINACVQDQLSGVTAKDWAVNGVAGGADNTGRVTGTGMGATFTAPAQVPNPATVAVSVDASFDASAATQLVANITITDSPEYQAVVSFTGLLNGLFTGGTASLKFVQFEDIPDTSRYALAGGSFETSVNYPGCDPVAKVTFTAGMGEGEGVLVVNKENNQAGKRYFWSAHGLTREVQIVCDGMALSVPLDVALDGEGSYQDIKSIAGSGSQLTGGSISWSFTRP